MKFDPSALVAAGAVAALLVTGCAKGGQQSSTTTATSTSTTASSAPAANAAATTSAGTTSASTASGAAPSGDPNHGKQLFAQNCATCHGQTGTEGGVGPSLKDEKSRKNTVQAIAWIKNPQPPMPKLWPQPLSDRDVTDLAAYVESL